MIEARGHNGTVTFDGAAVSIDRKGALARLSVGKGTKRIPVTQITAVQWKPAGAMTNGFIQFTLAGGVEQRSQFGRQTTDAARDENSVLFTKKQQPLFEQLRTAVEQAVMSGGQVTASASPAPDAVEQLERLAKLRDAGAITVDEFDAKKADLLGRI